MLGTPTPQTWAEGLRLANVMNFRFAQFAPTALSSLVPNASPEAITLMRDLMLWDPTKRPTASGALQYPFFQVGITMPTGAPASAAAAKGGGSSSGAAAAPAAAQRRASGQDSAGSSRSKGSGTTGMSSGGHQPGCKLGDYGSGTGAAGVVFPL